MRIAPLLFASLCVLDAGLVLMRYRESRTEAEGIRLETGAETSRTPAGAPKPSQGPDQTGDLAIACAGGDWPGAVASLRALGVPEGDIRRVLIDLVRERQREARAQRFPDDKRGAWWRKDNRPDWMQDEEHRAYDLAERQELEAATLAIRAATPGADAAPATGAFATVPADKREAFRRITADYRMMREEIDQNGRLFRLPTDEASQKLLDEERDRDLRALLGEADWRRYSAASGSNGRQARRMLGEAGGSEGEFLALVASAEQMQTDQNLAGQLPEAERAAARRAALESAAARERALLGEDRFLAARRALDQDYINLRAAAARFDLPDAATLHVYDAARRVAEASQAIETDTSLDNKARQQAFKRLAADTRADIRHTLGDDIGDAYLAGSMRWIGQVEAGRVVEITPLQSVQTRPAKPLPKPAAK